MRDLLNHDRPLRGSRRLALGVALALFAGTATQAEPRLTVVVGAVEIGRGEPPKWEAASEGSVLGAGDSVRTGRAARAEIDLGSATTRLFENSLLRLPPDLPRAAVQPPSISAAALPCSCASARSDPFECEHQRSRREGHRFAVLGVGVASSASKRRGRVRAGRRSTNEMLVRPGFAAVGSARAIELSPAPESIVAGLATERNASAPPAAPPSAIDGGAPAAWPGKRPRCARADQVIGAVVAPVASNAETAQSDGRTQSRGARAAPNGERCEYRRSCSLGADRAAPRRTPGATSPAARGRPVSVADRSGLARGVREQVAETVLNGGVPGASGMPGGPAIPLSLQILTSGGPNRVVVTGPAGQLAQLTRGDIVSILASGDPGNLGPALLSALAANGVNPLVFAQQLRSLLH